MPWLKVQFPKRVGESDIRFLFGPFGHIEELYIINDYVVLILYEDVRAAKHAERDMNKRDITYIGVISVNWHNKD